MSVRILYESDLQPELCHRSWIALGNFDGVHLGHREILKDTIRKANLNNCTPGVLLLDPHPEMKFSNKNNFLLTTLEEKLALIQQVGLEFAIIKPFTEEFAKKPPEGFAEWLSNHLGAQGITVGFDYNFGCNGSGTTRDLIKFGHLLGFAVSVLDPVTVSNGITISSQLCRHYIRSGWIEKANEMLGSSYQISGSVIKGEGIGRTLGFPTANLPVPSDKVIPKAGVYLVRASIGMESYYGVCNIGKKPTFNRDKYTIEVYIFDISRILYDQALTINFLNFLRPEQRFPDVDALKQQMSQDVRNAKNIIKKLQS